ncbi:hypothetical protein WH285_12190 [Acinetobacter johnsonii]|uniref:hypothetical protein n=1 Tax=Acinetobacter johnsonii TaxID=40214 RepID=UPI0030B21613
MAIYFLFGLIFLLIIGLFVLVLKPEWLEWIRNKLNIEATSTVTTSNNPVGSAPQNSHITGPTLVERQELNHLKSQISTVLNQLEINGESITINNDQPLTSAIDNFKDYLNKCSEGELFLVRTFNEEISNLDIDIPDDHSQITKYNKLTSDLEKMNALFSTYFSSNYQYRDIVQGFYKSSLSEINEELKKFRKLKDILSNSSTIKVYESAKRKYSWAFYIYLISFFTAIYAALHFSLYIIQKKKIYLKDFGMDTYDYWTIKISAIFIFITVITFLIKQATHYQKKKDEAERTMLELKALPSYLADLEPKDATNLRKDLASKYFGKSNDNSTLNEIGNIISEQLKNSTEVAKSSAEVIKSLTPPKK